MAVLWLGCSGSLRYSVSWALKNLFYLCDTPNVTLYPFNEVNYILPVESISCEELSVRLSRGLVLSRNSFQFQSPVLFFISGFCTDNCVYTYHYIFGLFLAYCVSLVSFEDLICCVIVNWKPDVFKCNDESSLKRPQPWKLTLLDQCITHCNLIFSSETALKHLMSVSSHCGKFS